MRHSVPKGPRNLELTRTAAFTVDAGARVSLGAPDEYALAAAEVSAMGERDEAGVLRYCDRCTVTAAT